MISLGSLLIPYWVGRRLDEEPPAPQPPPRSSAAQEDDVELSARPKMLEKIMAADPLD